LEFLAQVFKIILLMFLLIQLFAEQLNILKELLQMTQLRESDALNLPMVQK